MQNPSSGQRIECHRPPDRQSPRSASAEPSTSASPQAPGLRPNSPTQGGIDNSPPPGPRRQIQALSHIPLQTQSMARPQLLRAAFRYPHAVSDLPHHRASGQKQKRHAHRCCQTRHRPPSSRHVLGPSAWTDSPSHSTKPGSRRHLQPASGSAGWPPSASSTSSRRLAHLPCGALLESTQSTRTAYSR